MRHLIFDTETTNLIHNSLQPLAKQPRIIELFAMVLDDEQDWKEVETFHSYFNPGVAIVPEVTKITGIDDARVRNEPSFIDKAHEVKDVFDNADVVVAHNLSYDTQVIDFEFARIQRAFIWPLRKVCTVEASEPLKGYRLNLNALHTELFGEGFESAHRAENDVRATARCYVELVKRGEI